jgi:hypothetical protein
VNRENGGPERRESSLIINLEWERNLEKMFRALIKEKFDQWNKQYNPDQVFKVWAETMGSEKIRPHFRKVGWRVDMTIQEALKTLDDYCQEIEERIRQREEER